MIKKSDYIAALAEKAGLSKIEAGRVFDAIADLTVATAKAGEPILVPGIGKLSVTDKPERQARNPSTGQMVTVAAKKAPKVTIAKSLKDAIAG